MAGFEPRKPRRRAGPVGTSGMESVSAPAAPVVALARHGYHRHPASDRDRSPAGTGATVPRRDFPAPAGAAAGGAGARRAAPRRPPTAPPRVPDGIKSVIPSDDGRDLDARRSAHGCSPVSVCGRSPRTRTCSAWCGGIAVADAAGGRAPRQGRSARASAGPLVFLPLRDRWRDQRHRTFSAPRRAPGARVRIISATPSRAASRSPIATCAHRALTKENLDFFLHLGDLRLRQRRRHDHARRLPQRVPPLPREPAAAGPAGAGAARGRLGRRRVLQRRRPHGRSGASRGSARRAWFEAMPVQASPTTASTARSSGVASRG